jgi:hypothetical protein
VRTTLDIDEAVLAAAKRIAEREGSTAGAVISELARKGLTRLAARSRRRTGGFPTFSVPNGAKRFTSADVRTMLSGEGSPFRMTGP